jgi:hypothetical protein
MEWPKQFDFMHFSNSVKLPHKQGDQMRVWKNGPKCCPTLLSSQYYTTWPWKKWPSTLGYFCIL